MASLGDRRPYFKGVGLDTPPMYDPEIIGMAQVQVLESLKSLQELWNGGPQDSTIV